MPIRALHDLPKLHITPLAEVRVKGAYVSVFADDVNERRLVFSLSSYQAVRVTTADCFLLPPEAEMPSGKFRVIHEVFQSDWVRELTENLRVVDIGADFMDKARHFLFPLTEQYVEVVAHNISWRPADAGATGNS